MPCCAVKWCGKWSATSSLTKDGITFHRFPKCLKIKQKWIDATKRDDNWFPGKHHTICSRHFTKDCFRPISGNRRLLFDNAVPTQMLPCLQSADNFAEASISPKLEIKEEKIYASALQNCVIATYTPLDDSVLATSVKTETVDQDIFIQQQQSTGIDAPSCIPPFDSTLRNRQLNRTVIDLTQKLKKKNVALKRLRSSNRVLKRKVLKLQQRLQELEENN
ncbi:unnamed protein product [Chilo suppressalis]|uniref:THAP-type domain-containing protein n=1 Tax=Chilo suppressalis TaxID=168631 RepID=A0ABN8B2W3_CHISP|nr:hypothetical protein evm_000286 [Chilo suppressalis]CAH0399815.1 unnamed protein product [Chilo suppressalis]